MKISSTMLAAAAFAAMMVGVGPVQAKPASSLRQYETAERIAKRNLAEFDTLDFDVFTNQKWDRLKESHAQDITVHWPDGRVTKGIDHHIADLKALFVYAPDTRITEHPIRIASGEWTSVTGFMEGTFTVPRRCRTARISGLMAAISTCPWRPSAIGRTARWMPSICSGTTRRT